MASIVLDAVDYGKVKEVIAFPEGLTKFNSWMSFLANPLSRLDSWRGKGKVVKVCGILKSEHVP